MATEVPERRAKSGCRGQQVFCDLRFGYSCGALLLSRSRFLPWTGDAWWQADLRVVRRERKIGIPERITLEILSPAFAHEDDFPLALVAFFIAAPHWFFASSVMEPRIRRPHDAITAAAKAETEIDIIEVQHEIAFVEAARGFEKRTSDCHAGSADA